MAVRVRLEAETDLSRREREEIVHDVNLFLVLRDKLRRSDLRALRNELAQAAMVPRHAASNDVHPITGALGASQEEQALIGFRSLLQFFEARRQAIDENTITAPQVAELLGVSRQTPLNRVKEKTMLGIRDRGAWRFPLWQFDPQGPDGVLRGLPEVLEALEPQQAFAKMIWLRRPNATLSGREPVEQLRAGEVQPVVDAARAAAELP